MSKFPLFGSNIPISVPHFSRVIAPASLRHKRPSRFAAAAACGARPPFYPQSSISSVLLHLFSSGVLVSAVEIREFSASAKGMMNAVSSHHSMFLLQAYENHLKSRPGKGWGLGYPGMGMPSGGGSYAQNQIVATPTVKIAPTRLVMARAISDNTEPGDTENEDQGKGSSPGKPEGMNNGLFRDGLERLVGKDDSSFSGIDLATLIRKKYGRSYDVQLIKKEFMGRNLLAMNVMWKYREQRSFPLTEEEYLLRLDDVANTLKCWGAVSHIRNSLERLKERPRMGKAVSIFIDMDESGGRSNEWIYK